MKVPLFCGRDVERDNVGHKVETQSVKLCVEGLRGDECPEEGSWRRPLVMPI